MIMQKLTAMNGALCACGRRHVFESRIVTGSGALREVPGILRETGTAKAFVLSDRNTYRAAGAELCRLLTEAGIRYTSFTFAESHPEPDEKTLGAALMHMDPACDTIIGVGSGVINDTAKLLSLYTGRRFVMAATAPSMDGYASMTSSVTRGGLKISMPSRCADVIVGDTDVLRQAPERMLAAGVGDMLAKYVSLCEWRIAALVCGEYYCEEIAGLIRGALRRVTASADGLLHRDAAAVQTVFDALTAGSVAMNYAGISRPASGGEHYVSHVIDMRAAAFGTPADLHGIQCALGTLLSLRMYEKLRHITPDRARALRYAEQFDPAAWNGRLRELLGPAAESMIALEAREGKYDRQKHRARLDLLLGHWEDILRIIEEELPPSGQIEALMRRLGLPTDFAAIGVDPALLPDIFRAAKDIRDKYVLPRLLWDLGILDEFANTLNNGEERNPAS